jgi:hypothetical protein
MSTLDEVTQIAANLATVAAAGGVWVAYRQWKSGVRSQQEATALGIWKDYVQLALAHPDLASPDASLLNGDRRSERFRRYDWFVSAMLFACEQIVALQPHDREWRASIADHLHIHRVYLSHPSFLPDRYSLELRQLLTAVAGRASGPGVG